MTTIEKVARRKLSLLELASEMQNVSCACRVMGYSRQQFYEIRRQYQTHGAAGLVDRLPGTRGPHPNRVSEEAEQAVLAHCLQAPTDGCLRVAQELALKGVQISSTGVRAGCGAATGCSPSTSGCYAWSARCARRSLRLPKSR